MFVNSAIPNSKAKINYGRSFVEELLNAEIDYEKRQNTS